MSDVPRDARDPDFPPAEPVVVPHTELSPELLRSVVESFVLREGTDYGEREVALEQKVANVIRQLERREAHIVFDPESESVSIVVAGAGSDRALQRGKNGGPAQ